MVALAPRGPRCSASPTGQVPSRCKSRSRRSALRNSLRPSDGHLSRDARFSFVSTERAIVTGASGFVGARLARDLGGKAQALGLGNEAWAQAIASTDCRDATV